MTAGRGHGHMQDEVERIYAARFSSKERERVILWETLTTHFFQQFVREDDVVLDLAAGYCQFINAVRCGRKIAIDLNPTAAKMAAPGVEVFCTKSTELPPELSETADVVFVSNFFEHLRNKEEFFATLSEIRRILKPGGRVLVLQPNIRLTKEAYWDFIDHTLPLTEKSLFEALELSGFERVYEKVRFLPYTANGRLPVSRMLIRLYLAFPPVQWLLGKQTFVVAKKL